MMLALLAFERRSVKKIAAAMRRALPFGICAVYVAVMLDYYSTYLDWGLSFVPPEIPGAREDVIGFGFWSTWPLFFVGWLLAHLFANSITSQAMGRLSLAIFLMLSIADLIVSVMLDRQIPL